MPAQHGGDRLGATLEGHEFHLPEIDARGAHDHTGREVLAAGAAGDGETEGVGRRLEPLDELPAGLDRRIGPHRYADVLLAQHREGREVRVA